MWLIGYCKLLTCRGVFTPKNKNYQNKIGDKNMFVKKGKENWAVKDNENAGYFLLKHNIRKIYDSILTHFM